MDKTIKLACLLAMVIFSSCASRKDFVYLQDMDELQEYPMVQKYEAIIHRDDRLSIIALHFYGFPASAYYFERA